MKFKTASKNLPFYLAGFYARPEKLQEVLAMGGSGIQVKSYQIIPKAAFNYDCQKI